MQMVMLMRMRMMQMAMLLMKEDACDEDADSAEDEVCNAANDEDNYSPTRSEVSPCLAW